MNNIINIGKWAHVLDYLKPEDNPTMLRMSLDLEITYCHFTAIIKELETLSWLKSTKEGRRRIITLTRKGIDMRNNVVPMLLELKTIRGKR